MSSAHLYCSELNSCSRALAVYLGTLPQALSVTTGAHLACSPAQPRSLGATAVAGDRGQWMNRTILGGSVHFSGGPGEARGLLPRTVTSGTQPRVWIPPFLGRSPPPTSVSWDHFPQQTTYTQDCV